MPRVLVLRVGAKGEIYTTREIRERLGIREGGHVIAYVLGDMLIIKPLPSIEEKIRRVIIRIDPERIEELSVEAQREISLYE